MSLSLLFVFSARRRRTEGPRPGRSPGRKRDATTTPKQTPRDGGPQYLLRQRVHLHSQYLVDVLCVIARLPLHHCPGPLSDHSESNCTLHNSQSKAKQSSKAVPREQPSDGFMSVGTRSMYVVMSRLDDRPQNCDATELASRALFEYPLIKIFSAEELSLKNNAVRPRRNFCQVFMAKRGEKFH